MSPRLPRRLSVVAVSASLAGLGLAPHAGATVWGDPRSPLTVNDTDGTIEVVGGASIQVPGGTGYMQAAWSQDGSKIARIQGSTLLVSNADGTDSKIVAVNASHPVFVDDDEYVVFSGTDANGTHLKVAWANGDGANPSSPMSPHTWDLPQVPLLIGTSDIKPDFGGGTFAFVRAAVGAFTGGIWVRGAQTSFSPVQVVAANADAPTVSPDGTTVAYVAPDARGVKQVWTVPATAPVGGVMATPVQQTFEASAWASDPVYSPDGGTISFLTVNQQTGAVAVRSVAVTTDPAATANAETAVPTHGQLSGQSTLAYRTEVTKQVSRLAGADRLATAVAVSASERRADGDAADRSRVQASSAVLSRSDNFADALGGAALAAHKNGPLLLTDPKTLDDSVREELKRILTPGSTVYLLGGTGALSPDVEAAVTRAGFHPQRIAGRDRYETSVAIAQVASPNPADVLVATGDGFADALSAGAAAGANRNAVVVLTDDTKMPASTGAYLNHFKTDFNLNANATVGLWAVGHQALKAIDDFGGGKWWRFPEAGNDRYQTSYMLAHDYFGVMHSVGVATGLNWPDSLAGGALMGSNDGPLLLVDPATGITGQDAQLLEDNKAGIYYGFVFGGQGALGSFVDQQLAAGIAGPLGVLDGSGNPIAAGVRMPAAEQGAAGGRAGDAGSPFAEGFGGTVGGAAASGATPSRP